MNYYDFLSDFDDLTTVTSRLDRYVIELETIASVLHELQINLGTDNARQTSDALAPLSIAIYAITDALTHEVNKILDIEESKTDSSKA